MTELEDQKEISGSGDLIIKQKDQENDSEYGDFPPGTIVLAKMRSFPPWPAIVLPNDLVPENILQGKPKHPPVSAGRRKRNVETTEVDNKLWCVRFLRDDNFMWATCKDIQLLTTESIEKFLNSNKKPKKTIKAAYEMALNPPDLEEFIIYGSDGKPIAIDNEANDEDFEADSPINRDEFEEEEDDIEEEDDDEEEEEDLDDEIEDEAPKRTSRKRNAPKQPVKKTTKKSTPAKTAGRRKKIEPQEPETSSDEDWDIIEQDDEPVASFDIPSSKQISDELKKKIQLIKKTRLLFQNSFLETKDLNHIDLKSINSSLDSLLKLDQIESSLVKTTGLFKVLFDILKRPDLNTKDLKKIRKRLSDYVKNLYDVVIDVDERWDFVEREEEPVQEPVEQVEQVLQNEQIEQVESADKQDELTSEPKNESETNSPNSINEQNHQNSNGNGKLKTE